MLEFHKYVFEKKDEFLIVMIMEINKVSIKEHYTIKLNQITGIAQRQHNLFAFFITPIILVVMGIIIAIIIELGWGFTVIGDGIVLITIWGILVALGLFLFIFLSSAAIEYSRVALQYAGGEIRFKIDTRKELEDLYKYIGFPVPDTVPSDFQ